MDSVKAIRYQIGDIYDALVEISETANDPKYQTEAISLTKAIRNFTFLVTLCVWYDILSQVNVLSKTMQSDKMEIDNCLKLLKKSKQFSCRIPRKRFSEFKNISKRISRRIRNVYRTNHVSSRKKTKNENKFFSKLLTLIYG